MNIRNRITEFRFIPARELRPHPHNWRKHPDKQRRALRAVLEEIGFAGVELVYASERNGGALTIIDGHMRQQEAGDGDLPCAITDLNDSEADKLLALANPLAEMAEVDTDKLDRLLSEINTAAPAIDEMIADLKAQHGLAAANDLQVKPLEIKPPPKMAWILIGVPVVSYGEIAKLVEQIAAHELTTVDTTVNDG